MSENIVLTSVNERGIAEVILNRPEEIMHITGI